MHKLVTHADLVRDQLAHPPLGSMRGYVNLALASLYASVGDSVAARTIVRRRPYREEWPYYLAAQLLLEGRLAAAIGDTIGAVRSFRHYLQLRDSRSADVRADVAEVEADQAQRVIVKEVMASLAALQ